MHRTPTAQERPRPWHRCRPRKSSVALSGRYQRACCATTSARRTRASDAGVPTAGCPYAPAPKAARSAAMRASDPGSRIATDRPSSARRRARASSAASNRGCNATSAINANAAGSCGRVTVIETNERSQPAPLSSWPPSASAASAICGAERLAVPLVSSVAVTSASPDVSRGSVSAPERITSCAVTSGRPRALRHHDAQAVRQRRNDRCGNDDRPRRAYRGRGIERLRSEQRGARRRKPAASCIISPRRLARSRPARTRSPPLARRSGTCAARAARRPR